MILRAFAALSILASAASSAVPVDQSQWSSLKRQVQLSNGVRLAYVEMGDPNGPPVVLLHGYTDTSRSWSLVAPHLTGYRLLIPDLRGHGASDAPECCYSATNFAHDIRLFLDALKIERASVAGHSLGSMIAISLAAEHPQRVTKIALLAGTALVPVSRGDWLWTNVTALRFPIDPNSEFIREWAANPEVLEPAFATAARSETIAIKPHVWRGIARELAEVPVGRHAADVKAPVLILSGGKDPLFGADHHAALLKAFPGAASHVYPALGHNFLWEDPADVARRIADFLSRQ